MMSYLLGVTGKGLKMYLVTSFACPPNTLERAKRVIALGWHPKVN
jgi:hypothetical protein